METGVESTIKRTGLKCLCKQEAEGNKVRVETYRKNPKRCQKFGKKKISSYSFFQSTLTGHSPAAKRGVVMALEICLLCCLITEKWGFSSVGGIANWLSFLSY